jgi:hypothetical protein
MELVAGEGHIYGYYRLCDELELDMLKPQRRKKMCERETLVH